MTKRITAFVISVLMISPIRYLCAGADRPHDVESCGALEF